MFSLTHIYKDEFNIEQNLWDEKAKKEKEHWKRRDSGMAESIGDHQKIQEESILLSHTSYHCRKQAILEVVCLWVQEVSNESGRNDKQQTDFFKPCYFEGHTSSGGMDHQQLVRIPNTLWWRGRSQTHYDDVVGGPDSLERPWDRHSVIFHAIARESSLSPVFDSSDVGWISYKKIDPLPYVWETSKPSRLQNLLPLKSFWHFGSQKHRVAKKKKKTWKKWT